MRSTRTVTAKDLAATRWVTLTPHSGIVSIPARFGTHFRVRISENTEIQAPFEGISGQYVLVRIENDDTSHTVTLGAGWTSRGSVVISASASAVSFVEGLYDDVGRVWDVRGIPDLSSVYALAGAAPAAHATSHANGGTDEIIVDGLSGVLADPQTPADHVTEHRPGGGDELYPIRAAIADAAGGVVVDIEARTALNTLLSYERLGVVKIGT